MNTAASEWAAQVAARNAVEVARARGPINHEQTPTATNSSCLSVSVSGSSGKEGK